MISDRGWVKSLPKPGSWREIPLVPLAGEYLAVRLMKNNRAKTYRLHRLVAQHFLDNPDGLPKVNHKNGDKWDNRSTNLEWCTESGNRIHAYATGLQSQKGERNGNAKFTSEDIQKIRDCRSVLTSHQVAELYPVSASYIRQIWSGNKWKG
jgi:hypothetical protein